MVIPWATFVYAPELHELTTETPQDVRLEIHSLGGGFSHIRIVGTEMFIAHKVLDIETKTKLTKRVFYPTAKKLREYMKDCYFLAFFTTDQKGKIRSCSQIKQSVSVMIPTLAQF
jgi:hypothetical protein